MIAKLADFCIKNRVWMFAVYIIVSAIFGWFAVHVSIKTVFSELMPQEHEFVKTHEEFKTTFGGSNMVSIMLEVEGDRTIFEMPVLAKIKEIQDGLQYVTGVNQFQIISLAASKLREVRASTDGIVTRPLMWPELPKNQEEIDRLRDAVLENPLVYGRYVSRDLKSALITVDFIDHLVDYDTNFQQIMDLVNRVDQPDDGISFHVVGDPILFGWVKYYFPETVWIGVITLVALFFVLMLFMRTWRGSVIPIFNGLIAALWSMGIAHIMGWNFDPLAIVLAFLITARAISHSVQLVSRFEDEVQAGAPTAVEAAKEAMRSLFRPGVLGLVVDGAALLLVALTPIPMLQKVAYVGAIWCATIVVTACIMTPVLLSWVRKPHARVHSFDIMPWVDKFLNLCYQTCIRPRVRTWFLVATSAVFVVSGWYAAHIQVGDANPGSPILYPDHKYNADWNRINEVFQGSDRMFVVIAGKEFDALKEPDVLSNINLLQRYMEVMPQIGGSLALTDIVPTIKRQVFEGNPRFEELGDYKSMNGELMYLFVSGSSPGDLDRYSDARFQNGAVTFYFRDRQGETIRKAIARLKQFIAEHPMEQAEYRLAGGLVGVLAAINDVLLSKQIEAIALALLVVVLICGATYKSANAGMLLMVPLLLSNTITFSFMYVNGIGLNINTIPVAALGIGLGVDYAIYIVDQMKEEYEQIYDFKESVRRSLFGAGRAVFVTAVTISVAMITWFWSTLRFQAEMAQLIGLWLAVAAIGSLIVLPAIAQLTRPRFITLGEEERPAAAVRQPA